MHSASTVMKWNCKALPQCWLDEAVTCLSHLSIIQAFFIGKKGDFIVFGGQAWHIHIIQAFQRDGAVWTLWLNHLQQNSESGDREKNVEFSLRTERLSGTLGFRMTIGHRCEFVRAEACFSPTWAVITVKSSGNAIIQVKLVSIRAELKHLLQHEQGERKKYLQQKSAERQGAVVTSIV